MREAKIHQVLQLGDNHSTFHIDDGHVAENPIGPGDKEYSDSWSLMKAIFKETKNNWSSQTPHGVAITLELIEDGEVKHTETEVI